MMKTVNLVCVFGCLCTVNRVHGTKWELQTMKNNNNEYTHEYGCGENVDECKCAEYNAFCGFENPGLQYVPRLPRYITTLTFRGFLPVINSMTFRNISHLKVTYLELVDIRVTSIASDAFKGLAFLQDLSLETPGLKDNELAKAFNSMNKTTIKTIFLSHMGWTVILQDMFVNLYDSCLTFIVFEYTKLQAIDFKIFSGLRNLSSLYIHNNKLIELKMSTIEHLLWLDLRHNSLSKIPDFCSSYNFSQISYLPALRSLNLEYNDIKELAETSFQCLQLLETLNLRGNPINSIQNNFISSLKYVRFLDISDIANFEGGIGHFALNSTSVTELRIQNWGAGFLFNFKYCLNLTILLLSHTESAITPFINDFSFLTRIQKLDLSFTNLTYLPHEVFSKMRSLRCLNVSHNKITSWDGEKVFGNSTISTLSLNNNYISAINKTSFPLSMLNSIRHKSLDLSDNFYLCTCETLESVNWFKRHVNLLSGYPGAYKCNLIGTLLQNYNPTPESCTEKNIVLLVSIPVSVMFIVTLSAILLVYKCRWRLRYGVYLFMNRHNKYERIEDSDSFVYVGFVIYSDDDRSWVHNELLHRIEDQEGFRLCIRLRDFDVGKVHVDNIVDNMFLSEKIIVILSNNFAKDEWCHFQLLLAETRLLKQNTDMLVIFMLEEIRCDCLRASLYKLITDRQYALWSNDGTGNNLFWEQAVSRMKRSTAIN